MTHKSTAWAQLILSILYFGAYFAVLYLFLMGHVHVPVDWKDVFATLLSVLTGGVLMITSYWFQRQRQSTADREEK